jgi:predicted secreted protein
MPGAPGEERWVFQAKRPGSAMLRLEYRRAFEPANIPAAQRVSYQVVVR